MTDSIRYSIDAPMAYCGLNSLSPEPCALIPCVAIHACNPTRRDPRPVDNGTASITPGRLAWMALRAIGGGC